ncbi:hypothetical protein RND81_05G094000 [Saponaria officinalis]|uniref:UBA domain-containing protein n=1 Tax=Saponaria officinalis TaxID=3572 RepID=A0AAW1KZ48_SAPOF
MEKEYNNRSRNNRGGALPSYDHQPHIPMYRPSHSSSMYPNIGHPAPLGNPPPARAPPYHHSSAPPSSSGTGIRVQIKLEYWITPPPQLFPQMGDILRSSFQFDFSLERKILAEAEKPNQNWSRFAAENLPSNIPEPMTSIPSTAHAVDPVVRKYITSGLNREAVPLAVENFGDNPTKVREFANAFTQLREMGFSSNAVAEALLMYDNDTDKAIAHFLNSSS